MRTSTRIVKTISLGPDDLEVAASLMQRLNANRSQTIALALHMFKRILDAGESAVRTQDTVTSNESDIRSEERSA